MGGFTTQEGDSMDGVLLSQEEGRRVEKSGKCPYRVMSPAFGLLCFDPWLAEYVKPSKELLDRYCGMDFGSCPKYLAYEKHMPPGKRRIGSH